MRVLDACLFSGEAELLALRMMTLADVVDHFCVVACTKTHQGQTVQIGKILTAYDHAVHIAQPKAASLHWCHPDLDYTDKNGRKWARPADERGAVRSLWFALVERQHRDACLTAALTITDDPDAVILVSDVDEIPRPEIVAELGTDFGAAMLDTCKWWTMEMRFVSTLLTLRVPQMWFGTCVSRLADLAPQAMRDARTTVDLENPDCGTIVEAGVHLSWLGTDDERARKLATFSHAEHRQWDHAGARRDSMHIGGQPLVVEEFPGDWWWPAPLVDGSFVIPPAWLARA